MRPVPFLSHSLPFTAFLAACFACVSLINPTKLGLYAGLAAGGVAAFGVTAADARLMNAVAGVDPAARWPSYEVAPAVICIGAAASLVAAVVAGLVAESVVAQTAVWLCAFTVAVAIVEPTALWFLGQRDARLTYSTSSLPEGRRFPLGAWHRGRRRALDSRSFPAAAPSQTR